MKSYVYSIVAYDIDKFFSDNWIYFHVSFVYFIKIISSRSSYYQYCIFLWSIFIFSKMEFLNRCYVEINMS